MNHLDPLAGNNKQLDWIILQGRTDLPNSLVIYFDVNSKGKTELR